jgi:preprotein translocase subunit SecD
MVQLARWKVILVALAVVLSVIFALPNVIPQKTLDSLPSWVPAQKLNLGLDLQGGSYLKYEVDTAALNRERLNDLMEDVRTTLNDKYPGKFNQLGQANGQVSVTITDPTVYDEAYKALAALARPLPGVGGVDMTVTRADGGRVILSRSPDAQRAEAAKAIAQNRAIIERRINQLGTREPDITQQGANRLVIQAAGESDPEKLKSIIGKTAKLTFQMVDDSTPIGEALAGNVPPGSELLTSVDKGGGQILVKKRALVKGEMLTNAQQEFDQNQLPAVGFRFNGKGAQLFGEATTQNVGKRFAIVLDGKVISAPTIINPITGGSGIITGSFTPEEANELAILLRAGALAAPMNVIEQRSVGAQLGDEAVQAGKISTLVGFAAIVIFMLGAYGFLFGGISVLGLILNLLMLVAAMSVTQATLTLPGIAGLILTLAVAVDANVLIYERIRDEERGGAKPLMALDTGFKRASVSIYDANVTTLISAAIMYIFGSGTVKGFAWTLGVGVLCSLFTALLVSQVLIGAWFRAKRPKQLPI